MVAETNEPGASVSLVARRHDVNANLLFIWRRQFREGGLVAGPPALLAADQTFIPITVAGLSTCNAQAGDLVANQKKGEQPGLIEIDLPTGVRLRVDPAVDGQALRRVLMALKGVL